ncbi:hypothetical protein KSS87_012972 [Heliosperma pusillum]|nr:hypothetical protein KSS87_012972 [Heliosperma pusillum]
MTRKTVAKKGLVEATSSGVEVNGNPRKAITNKEKRKTRPDVDDEVENRPHSVFLKLVIVVAIVVDVVAIVWLNVTDYCTKVGECCDSLIMNLDDYSTCCDPLLIVSHGCLDFSGMTSKKVADAYGSPGGLFKLIKSMTEEQKRSVEDIGFGGLLELKASGFYHVMIDWLMERYDPDSRMFMIDEAKYFVMTRDDVYDAFMLPCGSDGNEVLRTSAKKKNNPD